MSFDEAGFLVWFHHRASKHMINPDPDAPEHNYDFRKAYEAGVEPDRNGNLPDEFRRVSMGPIVVVEVPEPVKRRTAAHKKVTKTTFRRKR